MAVNPWHPWHAVSIGKKVPSVVTAIIEIPRGSKNKYEIDKESGLLLLDRVMSSPMFYPINYGFIPQTYCDDGDALDIMVIGQDPAQPMCMMNAKVIGVMKMIDGGETDDKILAVHADDPQYKHFTDIEEIQKSNPHMLREIEQFFKTYKLLDNKKVEVSGWYSKAEAEKVVLESIELYNKNKDKLKS
ncbi:inorganic diphosphatase [Fluviispira vulneris]|uniref:inorganic diphosphatase n=1 Tax=Fluviispira vulneris TaxID=2763012 RepID=UPI0016473EA4|nr:inorganic diphosphatase [Fluviispira vulneris]